MSKFKRWMLPVVAIIAMAAVSTAAIYYRDRVNAAPADPLQQADALRKEAASINREFRSSPTGSHLLKADTLSTPQIAADSLIVIKKYHVDIKNVMTKAATAVGEALRSTPNNSEFEHAMIEENSATDAWLSALENLYQFAADPVHNVHVNDDGKIAIDDSPKYNELVDIVNAANERHMAAIAALRVLKDK